MQPVTKMSLLQMKAWLKTKHNIHVHDEWVEACLDWLKSEHQGQALNDINLKSLVYEQWLGSDLTEIAPPILPDGIGKQVKTELNGIYCLQMNCIVDVSESAYSQLQVVKGKVNENVLVTAATQYTQSQYNNSKPSRMMMLYLTDGHQSLQAIEYKPIKCLNSNLAPGTKVLVEGSITSRLGVLMLSTENIKILGGEVDCLAETNSQIQLLSKALSDESRSNIPEHFKNRISGPITNEPEKCQVVPKQWNENVPAGKRTNDTSTYEEVLMDDDINEYMLQEMKEIEMIERQHTQQEAEEWPDDGEEWPPDDGVEKWPNDDDVVEWPDENEEWPDDVDDNVLQSIPDDVILSESTKPRATDTQTVCERSQNFNSSSSTSWGSNNVIKSNNTIKSNPIPPFKSTNSTSTQQRVLNRQTVQPRSAVAPRINQSGSENIRIDHYSKRVDVKKESYEEVIMISDDDEEDVKQCNKTKQEIISLQDFLQLGQGTFKIKGQFTTLITGLSYDSSGWKLAATVTDDGGATTLDVDLDDKVLTQLIGFTVLEMMLMKKEMKSNKKEVAQRIKSGLAECQDALKKMHCKMTIRKENSQDHPHIVDVDYQKQ